MYKDWNEVSYFAAFSRRFALLFTFTILAFSIIGKLNIIYNPEIQNMSSIIVPGGEGLPYTTIMQIAGFSLIMTAVIMSMFSGFLTVKIPFLLRHFLYFLAALFISSIFAVVFKWFPADNSYAWLMFVAAFFVNYAIAIALSLLAMKMEDRKYNKLLANYKRRHKE